MQVIIKETEDGKFCLFDTRSNKFFDCGFVRSVSAGQSLLDIANSIVRKPHKTLVELQVNHIYGEYGNLDWMIADQYLRMNPDIKEKMTEKLSAPKKNRKLSLEKKPRKKKKE